MRALHKASAVAALLLATACSTPIQLPGSFVQLRDEGEGYRAVTSDDARVWVRRLFEPTEGDVAFWMETLTKDFVDQRGYELVAEGKARRADGEEGRWVEVTANVGGQRVDYLIAVWLDGGSLTGGNWLRIVEFAAAHDVYEQRIADVKAALATVR
jgi:hypothetical protein